MRRSLLDRMFPLLHVGALALAAAGVGFGAYTYFVPYQRQLTELKRRSGELRAVSTENEVRRKEVDRLKHDYSEVQGARNERLSVEGRIRSDLKVLKAQIEERLAPTGVQVVLSARRMMIRFSEDAIFDARGPVIHKAGQEALQALAEMLGDRTARLIISAPTGGVALARWVRVQFPTAADLSAARTGNTLKALAKAGIRADSALAVIGLMAAPEDPSTPATLEIEIEPRE